MLCLFCEGCKKSIMLEKIVFCGSVESSLPEYQEKFRSDR